MTDPSSLAPRSGSALGRESLASEPPPSQVVPFGDEARRAGRGGVAIAGAKLSFILVGFAQQIILPRVLGPAGYGDVSRVLAIAGVVNNVVIAVSLQGVSRTLASTPRPGVPGALRRTLGFHVVLALLAALFFAAFSGPIASAVGAPHLRLALLSASGVVFAYGVYGALVGALNGQQRFLEQAGLDVFYGLLRTAALVGGAATALALGESGVLGATLGFVLAALTIVPFAVSRAGVGQAGGSEPSLGAYGRFVLPLAAGQIFLNLLLQTDFLLLSRFASGAAAAAGLDPARAAEIVGAYRAVLLFSFLPYQLLLSITFVLFPMLSRAHADGDAPRAASLARSGLRVAAILTGLLSSVIAGLAPQVLHLAYAPEIAAPGGPALRVLALGMGSLAMLGVVCSALTSLRRERVVVAITALAVLAVAAAASVLVPRAPLGPEMLVASATGTSVGLAVALLAGLSALARVGRVAPPLATFARVGAAAAVVTGVGARLAPSGSLATIGAAALLAGLFVALLLATRELVGADLRDLARVVRRR